MRQRLLDLGEKVEGRSRAKREIRVEMEGRSSRSRMGHPWIQGMNKRGICRPSSTKGKYTRLDWLNVVDGGVGISGWGMCTDMAGGGIRYRRLPRSDLRHHPEYEFLMLPTR